MRKQSLALLTALVVCLGLASTASAAPFEFTNNADIAVPDNASVADPTTIDVTHPGLITRVEVRIYGVTHTRPSDLDFMVETPSGQFFYLMSDHCGTEAIVQYHWDFADDHLLNLGTTNASCVMSFVKPADNNAGADSWSTAPGASPVVGFAGLTGTNQTGEWTLHVADDTAGETGGLLGWEVSLDTTTPDALRIPPVGTTGTLGPITKTVSGLPRTISDVDVHLNDLTHTRVDNLDFALESPAGTKVIFASDGCGSDDRLNRNWIFDDESPTVYPSNSTPACASSSQRFAPANNDTLEAAFGAVLTGPFGVNLSAFDGQNANGNWKLYVNDDAGNDIGFLGGYDLAITMRGAKTLAASNPTIKSKKSGKKSIKATGRVTLAGEALVPGECAGSVKSTFQSITVKKKGKKKVTVYKKIVSASSNLSEKTGLCGFDVSAKLSKKYSGKKVRLVTSYLGGEFIAPFTRTTTEKIKKLKFK